MNKNFGFNQPPKIETEGNHEPVLQKDKNNIGKEPLPFNGKVETHSDMVYRGVGVSAIKDLFNCEYVRSSVSAKEDGVEVVNSNSKNKKDIYWTKGKDGVKHSLQDHSFLIVASLEDAQKDDCTHLVELSEVKNIYYRDGEDIIDILLPENEELRKSILT